MRTWYAYRSSTGKTAAVADEDWYHGSSVMEPFDRFDFNKDKPGQEGAGVPKHWNSHLGTHFSSDHQTAADLAFMHSGTVYHCGLAMQNPKHYMSEYDLDRHAFDWAKQNGYDATLSGRGRSEDQLREHPQIKQIARRFRGHLQRQGYDGITYGNEFEGPHLHECAIAFHPDDITIHSIHHSAEPCDEGEVCRECLYPHRPEDWGQCENCGEPLGGYSHYSVLTRKQRENAVEIGKMFAARKTPLDPSKMTDKHRADIRKIVDDVRRDEGAGGQCGFVSEMLANKYGWEHHGGYYHAPDGRVIGDHQWNVHGPSGTIIDATADQHGEGHDIRVIPPSDPEHGRYQYAQSDEDDTFRFTQADENRRTHGDYWWTGGPTEHARSYQEKVKRYTGSLTQHFAVSEPVEVHRGVYVEIGGDEIDEALEKGEDGLHDLIARKATTPGTYWSGVAGWKDQAGAGLHWTRSHRVAENFSDPLARHAEPKRSRIDNGTWHIPVTLHGTVAPEHIETDPEVLSDHRVDWYGHNKVYGPMRVEDDEQEALLKPGAPVHLTSIRARLPKGDLAEHYEDHAWDSTGAGVPHEWVDIHPGGIQATAALDPVKVNQHRDLLRQHLAEHHPDLLERSESTWDLLHRAEHTDEAKGWGSQTRRQPSLFSTDHEHDPLIDPAVPRQQRLASKDDDIEELLDLLGTPKHKPKPPPTEEEKAQQEAERQQRWKEHDEWQAKRKGYNPGDDLSDWEGYSHRGAAGAEWVPIHLARHFREHTGDQHPDSEENVADIHRQLKAGRGLTDPLMLIHHNEENRAYLGEGNHRLAAMERAGWSHVPMRVCRMYDGEAERGEGRPIPPAWRGSHQGRTPEMCRPSDVFDLDAVEKNPPRSLDSQAVTKDSGDRKEARHGAQDVAEGHPRGGPGVDRPGDLRGDARPPRRLRRVREALRRAVAADDDGGLQPLTWHPKAKKEYGKLDKPSKKSIDGTLQALQRGDQNLQTHKLTGPLSDWYATKASRGHRIVHRPNPDGGIHIGAVSLHDYTEAINRLSSVEPQASVLDLLLSKDSGAYSGSP